MTRQAIRLWHTFCKHSIFITFFCFTTVFSAGQNPYTFMNAGQLRLAIAKLGVLGSVLYIGAHPDDENTALIAFLAQDRLYQTGYLSVTRGDGGQNLIGSEQAEQLGLIRTQELLAARRIDGGQQFFTRAIDFGYSKSSQETMAIWDHDQVLSDMIWIIRRFQPDVIISRFSATADGGHGHHTASAILAQEAFQAAADPLRCPEQLSVVKPWQAKRLLWNSWRIESKAEVKVIPLEIGGFNPLLGKSYTEIAGESRSMHKSQGFGSSERRGSRIEQFVLLAGEPIGRDIFDHIDATWSRLAGAEKINAIVDQILQHFQDQNPSVSLPALLALYAELDKLPNSLWVQRKQQQLQNVIRMATGLWLEATADDYRAIVGQPILLTTSAVLRSDTPVQLDFLRLPWQAQDTLIHQPLTLNKPCEIVTKIQVPATAAVSQPYWLTEPGTKGMYQVRDQMRRGAPEPLASLIAEFCLLISGQTLRFQIPVVYRWTDPVDGENYRDVVIAPAVTLSLDQPLYLFAQDAAKKVRIRVRNFRSTSSGTVQLQLPTGWQCRPAQRPFSLLSKDAEQQLVFEIQAPASPQQGRVIARAQLDDGIRQNDMIEIRYPHIPVQTFFTTAESRLIRLPNVSANRSIGYIMGSGDAIPELLKQIGFRITLLTDEDLTEMDLNKFKVIIAGVRAFNTRFSLAGLHEKLNRFVEKGGIFLVQYNTNSHLVTEDIGPYPFHISRERVTVEEAVVTRLLPEHPLLTRPFRIDAQDFEGWIQERGLYFADQWDSKYQPLLSCGDPGEKDKQGGMLVTRYGQGLFIFSAYAWFRQMPAGVIGAYKVFLNMILAR